jgi:hypothetical protein
MADGDLQPGLGGECRQLGLPRPGAVAVGAARIRGDSTANAAVSWSVPTLTQPVFAATS